MSCLGKEGLGRGCLEKGYPVKGYPVEGCLVREGLVREGRENRGAGLRMHSNPSMPVAADPVLETETACPCQPLLMQASILEASAGLAMRGLAHMGSSRDFAAPAGKCRKSKTGMLLLGIQTHSRHWSKQHENCQDGGALPEWLCGEPPTFTLVLTVTGPPGDTPPPCVPL